MYGISPQVSLFTLVLIAGGTLTVARPLEAQSQKQVTEQLPGRPLSAEARKTLLQRVLTHPGVAVPGHRLAAIRVTLNSTNVPGATRTTATVVLFNHTAGEARRVVIDTTSGELLANQRLAGRPQSSREEFEEAAEIVRREPELASFLNTGGVLDGGFIVDDPAGSRHRMIQLKLLDANRRVLLRSITVDLTAGAIAAEGTAR